MEEDKDILLKRINEEDRFFKSFIDFISPDHYGYDNEIKDMLRDRKHSLVDDKLSAEKRARLSNKSKRRLARLDDRQCHTNTQIFDYMAEMEGPYEYREKGKKRKALENEAEEGGVEPAKTLKKAKPEKTQSKESKETQSTTANDAPVVNDRQQLLIRLQSKLDELRAKRGGTTKGMDYEEKKRLRRRLSKAKLKERRKKEKEKGQPSEKTKGTTNSAKNESGIKQAGPAKKESLVNGSPSKKRQDGHIGQANTVSAKGQKHSSPVKTSTESSGRKRPAVVDKDGRMVFSKFDFAVPGIVNERENDKKAKKDSGKDYKRLLEKQERLQSKLQKLEDADDVEGAKRLKLKTQWDAATRRAEGIKVKDDPSLLKKNLKRKEKRKEQSKRKWDSRNETVRQKKEEKQQKRKDNIQARQKDKKDRKLSKARKKGRVV